MLDADPAGSRPESGLSARASLALIAEQRAGAARSLRPSPATMLAAWGVAWTAGFGAFYLAAAGGAALAMPAWAAAALLCGCCLAAAGVTAREVFRAGRGVAGASRAVSAGYGSAWVLAFAAVDAFDFGLERQGLPPADASLLWPGSAVLVCGILYLAGGLLWRDRLHYGVGAWTVLVAAGGVAAGVPGNFAVMSLAGGGGLLAAAAVARRRDARRTGPG